VLRGHLPTHLEVRGIHSHIGSQIVRGETFLRAAEALVASCANSARPAYRSMDFGGGFGVNTGVM
jgi:diaminopimelate decarboxylase